jgi:V/A-type H+-transporting ATPase subunit D
MAKIRLTKNELKKQKDDLKRFTRYLPTLELKKKQLLLEIRKIQQDVKQTESAIAETDTEVSAWAGVFADEVDLREYIAIDSVTTSTGNIAGIDIPVFEDVVFEEIAYDFFTVPLWVDTALEITRQQIRRGVELEVLARQEEIVREELRITIQRIKLFEEVKIPDARENIRKIGIFLGDQQTAAVVRGKIAKTKVERKRETQSA